MKTSRAARCDSEEIQKHIENEDLEMLKKFFETHDAEIDCKSNLGDTPLMYALVVENTNVSIVQYLLDEGAHPLNYNKLYESPLSLAIFNAVVENDEMEFADTTIIKMLLRRYIETKQNEKRLKDSLEYLKNRLEMYESKKLIFFLLKSTDEDRLLDCFKFDDPKLQKVIKNCYKELRIGCDRSGTRELSSDEETDEPSSDGETDEMIF